MNPASERVIHAAIIDWLRAVLPENHIAWHPMNNPRSKASGSISKRLGMMKGMPDIQVIRPLGRIAFIEVKAEKGRLTPEQRNFRLYCVKWGIPHAVCRSIDEVRLFVESIGIETREAGR